MQPYNIANINILSFWITWRSIKNFQLPFSTFFDLAQKNLVDQNQIGTNLCRKKIKQNVSLLLGHTPTKPRRGKSPNTPPQKMVQNQL